MDGSLNFLTLAKRRDIQQRGFKTALLVGTILGVINYGDLILTDSMEKNHWFKLILTYLVPYSVATWASVQAIRKER